MPNLFLLKYNFIFIFLLGFFLQANAQVNDLLLRQMQSKYPEHKAIFLKKKKKISIKYRKKSGFLITNKQYSEMLHLGLHSENYARESISFSQFNTILNAKAYTCVPKKRHYKKQKVTQFIVNDVVEDDVFYNDVKEKTFYFPSISPGAKTILIYKEQILEARFLSGFYFSSYVPVMESELIVEVPHNVELLYELLGENTDKIHFSKKKKWNKTIYKWTASKLDAFEFPKNAPNLNYYQAHIILRIGKYADQTLLADVDDLYKWYYHFVQPMDEAKNDKLQNLVDSLTSNVESPLEKAKNIFYWVEDNIQYIAFEDGLRGFRPDFAEQVVQKRYGDCKDMTSLLVAMLRLAEIPAYFTWIGSRDIPYTYEEVPTPLVDNHMIVSTFIDSSYYFLDATANYLSFGKPSYFIQNKEALIGKGKDKYEIIKIPSLTKDENMFLDTCYLSIGENGKLHGKGKITLTGYPKNRITSHLLRASPKTTKNQITKLLKGKNHNLQVTDYQLTNLENKEKPLQINYELDLDNYYQALANKTNETTIYLNLNINSLWRNETINEKRQIDSGNKYKFTDNRHYILNLPETIELKHLPPNAEYKGDLFGFSMKYQYEEGKIVLTRELYINYLLLNSVFFGEWNQMIKELTQAYGERIVLSIKQ